MTKTRRRSLVTEYIRARELSEITRSLVIAFCEHEFTKLGWGYKCEKCGFYSGTNQELNEKIQLELPPKGKKERGT